jgi:hypothetical protein
MRNQSQDSVALSSETDEATRKQRSRSRQKAVLPARVTGIDAAGRPYSDLVHTLDITETGVRLGAVRCDLQLGSLLTLQYKQHKAEFRVIWVSKRPCGKEYQVGLRALVERDMWGLEAEFKARPHPPQAERPAARV